ncbi:TPA: hypothetical protein ACOEME_004745 [Enterobacter cloacae subsp. dissolvens]
MINPEKENIAPPPEIQEELHKLLLLRNGVVHYGGGIECLEKKVRDRALALYFDDPETLSVLIDVANYLRDISELAHASSLQEPGSRRRY